MPQYLANCLPYETDRSDNLRAKRHLRHQTDPLEFQQPLDDGVVSRGDGESFFGLANLLLQLLEVFQMLIDDPTAVLGEEFLQPRQPVQPCLRQRVPSGLDACASRANAVIRSLTFRRSAASC